MEKGRIKIDYNKEKNQVTITADADGLRYLANICLGVIGKDTPAGHFHLMEKMGNLVKGSIDTVIIYSEMKVNTH